MSTIPEVLFEEWQAANAPGLEMLWHGAALHQIREIAHSAHEFGAPVVVATHRSKSITLPVVRFSCPRGSLWVRDNFRDLNICVQWAYPVARLTAEDTRPGMRCFLEGLSEVAPVSAQEPWAPERASFVAWAASWDHGRIFMRKVWNSWPPREAA